MLSVIMFYKRWLVEKELEQIIGLRLKVLGAIMAKTLSLNGIQTMQMRQPHLVKRLMII